MSQKKEEIRRTRAYTSIAMGKINLKTEFLSDVFCITKVPICAVQHPTVTV